MPRRIFLSFASEDADWVDAFTEERRFGLPLGGDIRLVNYLEGENVEFGSLGPWLDKQVDQASVLIAFVSSFYCSKQSTCGKEWRLGLSAYQRGRLIFVPVMMDLDARTWWAGQRSAGQLSELPLDFQYVNFTDKYGKCLEFKEGYTDTSSRVKQLATKIREYLDKPSPVQSCGVPSSRNDEASEPEVIVLGHPTGELDGKVQDEAGRLLDKLAEHSLKANPWKNHWRNNAAVRTKLDPPEQDERIFVQPLAPGEAADYATDIGRTGRQLAAVGAMNARVALWLPQGQSDVEFERAAASASPDQFPALRKDAPEELANWLRELLQPAMDLVLQIETVGYPEGFKPGSDEAAALAEKLQARFQGVVGEIITPEPSSWEFYGDSWLRQQIVALPGNRAILAVHDLDIPRSADPVAPRKALEKKFKFIEDAINGALTGKPRKLDVFTTALVVKNPEAMPFAKYPSPRWKNWRLLRFENAIALGAKPDPRPDPNSLAVFRKELHEWVTS
jgi:hypothetical protein